MPIIATDTNRFSDVVKHEYEPSLSYCRDVLVVNDDAATFKIGAVLGQVTATGKWKLVTAAATDGSQVAKAVVIADGFGKYGDVVIPASTDTKVLALTRGPVIVGDAYLQLGADIDTDAEIATVKAALKAVGILVENQL